MSERVMSEGVGRKRAMSGPARVLWRKELRENRWKIAVAIAISVALAVLTALTYDYVKSMIGPGGVSTQVPEMFRGSLEAQLSGYSTFVWMSWYGKSFYQFGAILAIIVGMGLFSSEVARGTLSFLLARPFGRREIFATKFAAGAISLLVPLSVGTLLLVPLARLAGHGVDAVQLLLGLPVALSGVLVLFALSVTFSVLIDEPVKAGAAAGGVALLLSIPSWFERVRALSIYSQMQALPVLRGEGFPWGATAAMLGIAVLLYYAGLAAFRAREY